MIKMSIRTMAMNIMKKKLQQKTELMSRLLNQLQSQKQKMQCGVDMVESAD